LPLAALPLPLVVLAWALLVPQADFLAPVRRWTLPVVLIVLSLLCLGLGWARSGFDVMHPKLNTALYWLDADRQAARWVTVDDSRSGRGTGAQLDEWTGQFFAAGSTPILFNPWLSGWFDVQYPALQASAPLVSLPHSQVNVLEDRTQGVERTLRLQIAPAADVQDIFVQLQAESDLQIAALNGKAVDGRTAAHVRLNINGRPQDAVTVDLRLQAGDPVQIAVQDRRLGLPEVEPPISPRPAWMAAAPLTDVSDSTIVAHTVTIE
jgi:hypothetical protein